MASESNYSEFTGTAKCPVCKMPMNGNPEACLPDCVIRLTIEQRIKQAMVGTVERCIEFVESHVAVPEQDVATPMRALFPDLERERLEAQAVMVEQCLAILDLALIEAKKTGFPEDEELLNVIRKWIMKVSSAPNFLARERLEARLDQAKKDNADLDVVLDLERRLAGLERPEPKEK